MEFLKNANVAKLIYRATLAGAKKPSIEQLKTLAIAVGDREAYRFLCAATVQDMAMVKTAACVFNGEAPKSVSDGAGTLFGLVGEKETTIASEDQKRIYDIKAVLKDAELTEEQKSMAERRKVEDKHPETSDHKTAKSAVDEPLKEKTDPEIKKVLERGEKDPVEKRDKTASVAKTASAPHFEITVVDTLNNQEWGGGGADSFEQAVEVAKKNTYAKDVGGDHYAIKVTCWLTPEQLKTASVATPAPVIEITSSANTSSVAATVTIAAELGKKDIEPVIKPVPEDKKHDPMGQLIDIANEPKKDIKPVPKTDPTSEAVLDTYVERIKKGEDIKKVLSEFMFLIEVSLEEHKAPKKPVEKAPADKKEEKKDEKAAPKKDDKEEKKPEPKKEEKEPVAKKEEPKAAKASKNIMAATPGETVEVLDPNKQENVAVTVVGPSKRIDTGESFMVTKDETGNFELFPAGTEYTQITEQQKQTFAV